jgi:NTP pyrophosphatase (non-canonical NTP hydrolase)
MNGKMSDNLTFEDLFDLQMHNQSLMLDKGMYKEHQSDIVPILPHDDIELSSYHIQQLVSEIGEVLSADKRWKNFRNNHYDKNEKKEEIADCFIVLMNVAMYSGISAQEMSDAIYDKMLKVKDRISSEN